MRSWVFHLEKEGVQKCAVVDLYYLSHSCALFNRVSGTGNTVEIRRERTFDLTKDDDESDRGSLFF